MIRLFKKIEPKVEHTIQLDKILAVAREVSTAVEATKDQLVAKANGAMYKGAGLKDAGKS